MTKKRKVLDIITGLEHEVGESDEPSTGWSKSAAKIESFLKEDTPDEIREALGKMARAADFSTTEFREYKKYSHDLMLRVIPFLDFGLSKDE